MKWSPSMAKATRNRPYRVKSRIEVAVAPCTTGNDRTDLSRNPKVVWCAVRRSKTCARIPVFLARKQWSSNVEVCISSRGPRSSSSRSNPQQPRHQCLHRQRSVRSDANVSSPGAGACLSRWSAGDNSTGGERLMQASLFDRSNRQEYFNLRFMSNHPYCQTQTRRGCGIVSDDSEPVSASCMGSLGTSGELAVLE